MASEQRSELQSQQRCQLPCFADEASEMQREGVIWLHISLEMGAVGVMVWGPVLAVPAPHPASKEAWPTMLVWLGLVDGEFS